MSDRAQIPLEQVAVIEEYMHMVRAPAGTNTAHVQRIHDLHERLLAAQAGAPRVTYHDLTVLEQMAANVLNATTSERFADPLLTQRQQLLLAKRIIDLHARVAAQLPARGPAPS